MYEDHVLEHYGNPYHKGAMPNSPTKYSGKSISNICGDEVVIKANINNGMFDDIWWQGDGCCFSQAATSMLVKYAIGKTHKEMKLFDDEMMLKLFRAECPKTRRGCVLVALHAMKNLIENFERTGIAFL